MMTTQATVSVFLHEWDEINPEQHPAHVSCEREGCGWSNRPKVLTVPEGWHVAEANDGMLHLYDAAGKVATFVQLGKHRRSVQVCTADGLRWLPMGEAESVCCPTCGHAL